MLGRNMVFSLLESSRAEESELVRMTDTLRVFWGLRTLRTCGHETGMKHAPPIWVESPLGIRIQCSCADPPTDNTAKAGQ